MTEVIDQIQMARPRRFRRYPAYKDSGVEWLGGIPAHWEVRRLGATVTGCQNGVWGEEADEVHDLICVRVADFDRTQFRVRLDEPTMRSIDPRIAQTRRLKENDLLLEKSGGGDNQPVGTVVIYDHREPAVCSNFVARMPVADGYHPRYLTYLHSALYAARINVRSIKQSTGIQNLDSERYLNESIGLPRVKEQHAIAAFLDGATTKIDGLVERKERLIELLQEKRTALITRAVTRGLDPNAPMKDSGVGWLGEIPSHWRVGKLKHACKRVFVGIAEAATFAYVDQGVPMLRSTDVRANRVRTDDIRHIDIAFADRLSSKQLRTDDIVTVRTGNAGVSAVVPPAYDRGQCFTLVVSRPTITNDSRYFCYWLNARTGRNQFKVEGMGTAQVNISVPIVQNALVYIPPPEEQRAITTFLDSETAKIDALIATIRQAIHHLKEFRTALISAAVTGKIDVREEAP